MTQTITLALSKGRIFEETLPLLKAAGIEVLDNPETSRKLILDTNQPHVRVLVVRATDVPTYVQYGGADLGITGKDTLLEHGSQGLYQPLDLQIAKCRISVAVRADFDYASAVKQGCDCRPGLHWQHVTCQPAGRGGAHHGYQFPAGGQPGRAQAQDASAARHHRSLLRCDCALKPTCCPDPVVTPETLGSAP